MSGRIVILGHGAVGKATAQALVAAGRSVVISQRKRPADLVAGADFAPCDALDAAAMRQVLAGATQVVLAIGLPYVGKVWRASWPVVMANVLAGCRAANARLVFVDNLYMYGPQTEPLREDMPLTDYGVKPATRAAITRQWQAASRAGEVRVAALRAPDFFGPGVGLSHIGDVGFGALARGKAANLLMAPDIPHAFAYVPDIARAVVALLDADDDAYGQAWHVPCAPARTPREILEMGMGGQGGTPRISAIPLWLLPLLGLFVPALGEFWEMRFLLARRYEVDSRKFAARFGGRFTPLDIAAQETAQSFRWRA